MYGVEFKQLTGTPKLFLDFINCEKPACGYFRYDFRSINSYRLAAEQIDKANYQRERVASILNEAATSFNLSPAVKDNIERLRAPNSLCVFAGQQTGMLLGPMYTVLKALTAYKLAHKLESELKRPVIPCFWMATDDHDFDEIKTAGFLNRDGECKNASYEPSRLSIGAPVSDYHFGPEIVQFLNEVDENLIDTEFKTDILSFLRTNYAPGKSITGAFVVLFEKYLSKFGIVPVDPNYPGLKELFLPVFQRDIENHDKAYQIFESQSREIISAGYHRQVHKAADSLNLFYNDGARRNIIAAGGQYRLDGTEDTLVQTELLEMLKQAPQKFSPNVALRPIAQNMAFPTVCQIVGPSEAAYFAQIAPLFDYHGVPWPVIRPRLFATLVEPHIAKLMRKLSIDFAGLINDQEYEIGRVIKNTFPSATLERFDELKQNVEKPLLELGADLKKSDMESYQAVEHAQRRIDHELNHLSKKLFQTHKKKHEEARARVLKTASFLLPCGKFQERVLSPVYFANKFGSAMFEWLDSRLDLELTAHQVVEIEL